MGDWSVLSVLSIRLRKRFVKLSHMSLQEHPKMCSCRPSSPLVWAVSHRKRLLDGDGEIHILVDCTVQVEDACCIERPDGCAIVPIGLLVGRRCARFLCGMGGTIDPIAVGDDMF